MYFPASASIAAKHPGLAKVVKGIDRTFKAGGEAVNLSADELSTHLNSDQDEIETVLNLLLDAGNLESALMVECPHCDTRSTEAELAEYEHECPSCYKKVPRSAKRIVNYSVAGGIGANPPRRTREEVVVDGVHVIGRSYMTDRDADVVFAHGLGGDWRSSWVNDKDADDVGWLSWIAEERPNINVLALSYDTSKWAFGKGSMALPDTAKLQLQNLSLAGVGGAPLVLVGHSMGGLLSKQMVETAVTSGNAAWKEMMASLRGVALISTPNVGSVYSSLAEKSFSRLFSAQTRQMQFDDAQLRRLNDGFRNGVVSRKIIFEQFCEEEPGELRVLVVSKASADVGVPGCVPIPIQADHVEIAKPKSTSATVYRTVVSLIDRCVIDV